MQHPCRDLLYLDLALEAVIRGAAERGTGSTGQGASSLVGPLLQNLVLSTGDNEELAYCLKAWQDLPEPARSGQYPSKEVALKVRLSNRTRLQACWFTDVQVYRGRACLSTCVTAHDTRAQHAGLPATPGACL